MARRPELTALPFWPRCLNRAEAARYVGVSVEVFDAEVRAGIWPLGRARGAKGGRLTWDRLALDAAEDQRSGLVAADAPGTGPDLAAVQWEMRLNGATTQNRPERR